NEADECTEGQHLPMCDMKEVLGLTNQSEPNRR
ncbi:MAG: hypothetical protein ACI81L_003409, partial [Verrucomicrobiales bacterium]